jgi:two-component system OmpR family sensor kinase
MRTPGRVLSLRSSLPAKLALVAVIFVVAVGAVRILSLDRLAHVDAVSEEIRNRWPDSIRLLGNLNDQISDVRTAEAEVLLSRDAAARDVRSEELRQSLDLVTQGIDRYRSVPHDADELLAFDTFHKRWAEHVQDAQTIVSLVQSGQAGEAISRFDSAGRSSFEAADEELVHVTDLTGTKAEAARNTAVQAIARAQRWVSDLILATLVLFVALALYLWRSVSRPLLNLADLMRRLASHDTNFSIPLESRRDEIGKMARSLAVFRRNTIELLESRKSLSRQAEVLMSSLEKERALAAEQRNFISTTSHEFRTPLSSIDGHAQRLIATKSSASPADIAARATKIRSAVFRMTSLVASLTNAMELTHGPLHPRPRQFNLAVMLRDLARYYREIGIAGALEEHICDLPAEITGDPELLYHAFSNLISNAAKYSPENGTVILKARAKDGWIEVTVEDRGLGIPSDEIDRVRERFYRGSNVGSVPGTGIGLHVVDKIVREHGGRLEIDSEVEKGTRVTVILPIGCQPVELQALTNSLP